MLKNVSINVHRGDYLGIVGANGSGKTTLLKVMLGLLPLQRGSVKLFGQPIGEFKDWPKIGYISQRATQFDARFPVTVEQVVLMGRYARRGLFKRPTKEDRAKVKHALEQVELWQYRKRLIGNLSGGQQQRVFIARALASDPEVLFLDEPTVSVDEQVKTEFYRLLKRLNEKLNLTIILITHDSETIKHEAMHLAEIDTKLTFYSSAKDYEPV